MFQHFFLTKLQAPQRKPLASTTSEDYASDSSSSPSPKRWQPVRRNSSRPKNTSIPFNQPSHQTNIAPGNHHPATPISDFTRPLPAHRTPYTPVASFSNTLLQRDFSGHYFRQHVQNLSRADADAFPTNERNSPNLVRQTENLGASIDSAWWSRLKARHSENFLS